eukprot:444229_1
MTTAATKGTHALLTESPSIKPKTSTSPNKKALVVIFLALIIIIIITAIVLWSLDVFKEKDSKTTPGLIGQWPTFGGTIMNQQMPPKSSDVILTPNNILNLNTQCIYESPGGLAFTGYITVDNNNHSYFSDGSGYITSVDSDTCQQQWRVSVSELLGYNNTYNIGAFETLTLFQDSTGNKGALFAAPSTRHNGWNLVYPHTLGVFAVAVHLNNGSLWWKVPIAEDNDPHSITSVSHGFYVDGKYAYGGLSNPSYPLFGVQSRFIGRHTKIDIDKHEIVNQWYPFEFNLTNRFDENNRPYNGIGIYAF